MSSSDLHQSATPIEGRTAFQSALSDAFRVLADSDCREVWLCDRHFGDWPLGDAQTLDQLTRWARVHRRLVVLAVTFELVARRHPRWAAWRRRWDHVVDCRVVDEADADSIRCLFLAPPLVGVQLHDSPSYRGSVTTSPSGLLRMRSELDAYLQRSHQSFPATTLGL